MTTDYSDPRSRPTIETTLERAQWIELWEHANPWLNDPLPSEPPLLILSHNQLDGENPWRDDQVDAVEAVPGLTFDHSGSQTDWEYSVYEITAEVPFDLFYEVVRKVKEIA